MKWRKLTTFLMLFLVFVVITGARYSRYQAPQWIELITGETWALRVDNLSATRLFEVTLSGTSTTNLTVSGDVDIAGEVSFSDAVYSGVSDFDCTSGATATLTNAYKFIRVLNVAGDAQSGVTLPDIVTSGQELVFKQVGSATTPFLISPYDSNDAVETAKGTYTGTILAATDADGEVLHLVSVVISGTSNVWYTINTY